jgi:hypothetical protein
MNAAMLRISMHGVVNHQGWFTFTEWLFSEFGELNEILAG